MLFVLSVPSRAETARQPAFRGTVLQTTSVVLILHCGSCRDVLGESILEVRRAAAAARAMREDRQSTRDLDRAKKTTTTWNDSQRAVL